MTMITQQIKNLDKEREIIQKENQMEILELKNTINDMKKFTRGLQQQI